MIRLLFCVLGLLLFVDHSVVAQENMEEAVRKSVSRQMEMFPLSTLKDLYKSFFQDEFGPGHIVSDTTSAGAYLRRELDSYTQLSGEIAEPLGWKNNYCRVNLSVLKTGQVPYDIYFDVFVRSVNNIQPISVSEWKKEWSLIEGIIASMNLDLPDYDTDKKAIDNRLDAGEYVGHHSELYEKTYSPHYRIMSRELFEKEIKPLLGFK